MQKIIDGYRRFNKLGFKRKKALFEKLSHTQNPEILFITCSDSRIDPNLITQTDPGELFVIRNAGNMVPPHLKEPDGIVASVEFAVKVLGVRHIIVCGHSNCGAMKGALNPSGLTELPKVKSWLSHCDEALRITKTKDTLTNNDQLKIMTQENVLLQVRRLEKYPEIAERRAQKKIELHGWIYDIGLGSVHYFSEEKECFLRL